MASFHYIILSFFLFSTAYAAADIHGDDIPSPSPFAHLKVIELVDEVCKRTSNYTVCVSVLYSDPRTPDADGYTLAYISFGLAYLNTSKTLDHITQLLKNSSSSDNEHQNLQRCQRDYKKGVLNLESSFNDLNSETFFTLPRYASDTAHAAADCEAYYPPLKSISLKFLCEICFEISKLFTVSS